MKRFMPLAWYRGNIMQQTVKASRARVWLNKLKTTFSKPQNAILLALGILLTFSTVAPMISIALDTVTVHVGSVDSHYTGLKEGYTLYNWVDLFTGKLAKTNLWTPLLNSVLLSVFSCFGAIFYGGLFAYLVTRTNMRCKKYLSSIFIFPYIMPQWTLAVIWQNLFDSNLVTFRHPHAAVVVSGHVPQRHGALAALRAVRVHPHRRHLPQHGREP